MHISPARGAGFAVARFEPTRAGETFLAVEAPWYRPKRLFAGALTLDYGRDVLLGGIYRTEEGFTAWRSLITHQFLGHVDLALSPIDRLQLSLSLPVVLDESGTPLLGVSPNRSVALGDPRIGITGKIWSGEGPHPTAFHLAIDGFIPVGTSALHAGDETFRGLVRAILTGGDAGRLPWAINAGVLLRKQASLNSLENAPGSAASELQASAALHFQGDNRNWSLGPELLFATGFVGPRAFQPDAMHMEALLSARLQVSVFQLEPGFGVGLIRSVGTPSYRALLRVGFAPTEETPPPPELPTAVTLPPPRDDFAGASATPVAPPPPAPEPPSAQEPALEPVEEPLPPMIKILFGNASDRVPDTAAETLAALARGLISHPAWKVRVLGHSDDRGNAANNQRLSERRARATADVLTKLGVPARQLDVKGLGVERVPGAAPSPEGRPESRRVDLEVTLDSNLQKPSTRRDR